MDNAKISGVTVCFEFALVRTEAKYQCYNYVLEIIRLVMFLSFCVSAFYNDLDI